MNLQHLKYAVEVERVGSITEAADNLYLSQPSLSKAIRDLEASVGFAIFERTGRGMLPTVKGRMFLDHAYTILRQLSEIEVLSVGGRAETQTLSLCAPRAEYIVEAVTRYCAALDSRNKLDVYLYETSADRAVEAVTSGHVRLGVVRYPQREDAVRTEALRRRGLTAETVWRFTPVVITSASGPLMRAGAAERMSAVKVQYGEECAPEDENAARVITLTDRSALLPMLQRVQGSYAWSAPMSPAMLERLHLRQIACETPLSPVCDMLIYPTNGWFSDGERAFLDTLFKAKNEAAFDRG